MSANPLIGRTITAVDLADDQQAIRFVLDDGTDIIARADGDCCSNTWIEHVEAPEVLLNTPVLAVEDLPLEDLPQDESEDNDTVIAFYGCAIRTANGTCTIDYRNASNGYYGGNLSWSGDDYFYGGVYGQNISTEQWRRIA